MKCNLGAVLLFGTLIFVGLNDAYGQNWIKLSLPEKFTEVSPYFLTENIGFIFDAATPNNANLAPRKARLYRTVNGGISWQYMPFFDASNIIIQQIYFESINRGYIAASNGIYETQDTGTTWRNIHTGSLYFNSVYVVGGKIFGYANDTINSMNFYNPTFQKPNWGPFVVSENDGKKWDTIVSPVIYSPNSFTNHAVQNQMRPYVFGNKDSLVFAENIDGSNNMFLVYSTNSGKDWSSHSMDFQGQTFTMGLFSFPHCNDIIRTYISSDDPNGDDVYSIARTSDFSSNWETVLPHFEMGAWVAGNNCAQYISYAKDTSALPPYDISGLFHSQDKGRNWKLIDGPDCVEIDDIDFHNISVVGGGAVVYVGAVPVYYATGTGTLWKTTNGGDGTLSSETLTSHISIDTTLEQGSTICDTSSLNIIFQNLTCNYTLLKNFSIDGLDSTQYSSLLKHHLACDGLPDSLLIKILPLYSNAGTFTFRAQFMNDEFQTIDTSFIFTLAQVPGNIEAVYIKRFSVSSNAGDTTNIPTYINSPQLPSQPGSASVDLIYTLNTNLLTPLTFIPISGVIADPVQTTKTTATVALHFDPSFIFSGETELGRLRCVAYVTDTLETDITLTGAAHSSGCLATLADSNTVHFILTGCGTQTLSNFMKFGKAYDILSIIPNPAQNSVQVELKNNGSLLHYELLDALGVMQKSGTTTGDQLQINLSGLSSGNYYFRLSGEGQVPVTKQVMIVK